VMYRANLSYDLTTEYLNDLVKLGLVEPKDGLYYITEKGKQLLELLKAWRQKKSELDDIAKLIREFLPEERERKKREKKANEAQPAEAPQAPRQEAQPVSPPVNPPTS